MTDEMSEYTKIAVVLVFMSAFMTSVLGITIMGIGIINQYSTKYSFNISSTAATSLVDLTKVTKATGPNVYAVLDQCLEFIDTVNVHDYDASGNEVVTQIYNYKTDVNKLVVLLSNYDRSYVSIGLEYNNVTTMYKVEVFIHR